MGITIKQDPRKHQLPGQFKFVGKDKTCPMCESDQAVVALEGPAGKNGEHRCTDCNYRFIVKKEEKKNV